MVEFHTGCAWSFFFTMVKFLQGLGDKKPSPRRKKSFTLGKVSFKASVFSHPPLASPKKATYKQHAWLPVGCSQGGERSFLANHHLFGLGLLVVHHASEEVEAGRKFPSTVVTEVPVDGGVFTRAHALGA